MAAVKPCLTALNREFEPDLASGFVSIGASELATTIILRGKNCWCFDFDFKASARSEPASFGVPFATAKWVFKLLRNYPDIFVSFSKMAESGSGWQSGSIFIGVTLMFAPIAILAQASRGAQSQPRRTDTPAGPTASVRSRAEAERDPSSTPFVNSPVGAFVPQSIRGSLICRLPAVDSLLS